ncbi:MAG: hypothetical protein DRI57_30715 [Deltaproteobacteria bacterium]|nr:MAG: hypothetical protein DRI57_30715 [Deltaproteobacteria bacterium]
MKAVFPEKNPGKLLAGYLYVVRSQKYRHADQKKGFEIPVSIRRKQTRSILLNSSIAWCISQVKCSSAVFAVMIITSLYDIMSVSGIRTVRVGHIFPNRISRNQPSVNKKLFRL